MKLPRPGDPAPWFILPSTDTPRYGIHSTAGRCVLLCVLGAATRPERHGGIDIPPPVLVLPRIFEPELCRALIANYEAAGGAPSGFMREVDGKTVGLMDPALKRRSDCTIEDAALRAAMRGRILPPHPPRAAQGPPCRISKRRAWSAISSPATTRRIMVIAPRTGTTRRRAPPIAASPSPST